MSMIAYDFQRPFAVDFFLQPAQGLFDWLAFFQFNFSQSIHFLSSDLGTSPTHRPPMLFSRAEENIFPAFECQPAKIAASRFPREKSGAVGNNGNPEI
jgi:hypothetical protein